jgi:hypothetical protein
MKKRVCIFFPNHHLAYSPTTINLYAELSKQFDVKIIAPYPSRFNNRELPNVNISYFNDDITTFIKVKALVWFLFYRLLQYKVDGKYVYSYSTLKIILKSAWVFKREASANPAQHIVAMDIIFLKLATKYFSNVNFVSLEIYDELLPLLKTIPVERIQSVVVQSRERYAYLFGERALKCFLIQNSPPFVPSKISDKKKNGKLIFNGTGSRLFGIFAFIEFLQQYEGLYTGVVKGNIMDDVKTEIHRKYQKLIDASILTIDDTYTEQSEIIDYIAPYEIGICFYNIDSIQENRFNYCSAPSGKMFNYLAAGVPVIGSALPGLKIIEEFGCGVLLEATSPLHIKNAVERIRADYRKYSDNCAVAAAHFSFDVMSKPFLDFLGSSEPGLMCH